MFNNMISLYFYFIFVIEYYGTHYDTYVRIDLLNIMKFDR